MKSLLLRKIVTEIFKFSNDVSMRSKVKSGKSYTVGDALKERCYRAYKRTLDYTKE